MPGVRFLPATAKRLPKDHAAYLAGLFDGEGSIVVQRAGQSGRAQHSYRLQVANTFRPVIDWCVENVGGTSAVHRRAVKNPRHQDAYYWYLGGAANVRSVLMQIRPWLIVKRSAADAALAALSRQLASGATMNERSKVESLWPKMQRLASGGMSPSAIAKQLDLPVTTVSGRLRRARAKE